MPPVNFPGRTTLDSSTLGHKSACLIIAKCDGVKLRRTSELASDDEADAVSQVALPRRLPMVASSVRNHLGYSETSRPATFGVLFSRMTFRTNKPHSSLRYRISIVVRRQTTVSRELSPGWHPKLVLRVTRFVLRAQRKFARCANVMSRYCTGGLRLGKGCGFFLAA